MVKRSADEANRDLTDDHFDCKVLGLARNSQEDAEATWKAEERSAELEDRDVNLDIASSGFEDNPFLRGLKLRTAHVTVAWSATNLSAESKTQAWQLCVHAVENLLKHGKILPAPSFATELPVRLK